MNLSSWRILQQRRLLLADLPLELLQRSVERRHKPVGRRVPRLVLKEFQRIKRWAVRFAAITSAAHNMLEDGESLWMQPRM